MVQTGIFVLIFLISTILLDPVSLNRKGSEMDRGMDGWMDGWQEVFATMIVSRSFYYF